MHKNQVVLVPELPQKWGGIFNLSPNKDKDQWIADIRLRIGNEARTPKGGNGVGIYYIRGLNQ